MSRTNICKNIVQSIKDYITDQVKLEPHRVEKHFVRRRKLSLLQVIIYLFFSSKASLPIRRVVPGVLDLGEGQGGMRRTRADRAVRPTDVQEG